MDLKCRLCGVEKSKSELVITLQSQSENVNLVDLVEYFCRIEISRDPKLNQNVCKVCKVSLETFMYFCDTIEKHQKALKQIKSEKVKAVVVQEKIPTQKQREAEIKDADLLYELFNDEDLDSPASTYQTEDDAATSASESTNQINLRNKEMKNCSVVLERLDITYEPSDTETSSEDEEEEETVKPNKRRRSSEGNATLLPSKRMRISPIKVKQERPGAVNLQNVKQVTWSDFKSYHKFFESEFSGDYSESQFNLPVPFAARDHDGSIHDDYAEKFTPWSSIELKCSVKPCGKKYNSPYELLLHNRNYHHNQTEKFIKCSLCTDENLNFSEYFQHVIEKHCRHLRYCCVMCSKMFFNFTALFHHYGSSHPSFTDIKMCLYDGLLFENYGSLEKHVAIHAPKNKTLARIKLELEKKVINQSKIELISRADNNNKLSCETCGDIFNTLFHLECHKKTVHSRKYSCDTCEEGFSSNYSLIMHENKQNCQKNDA